MPVEIKVLGADCARCRQLAAQLDAALAEVDSTDIAYEKIDDVAVIMSYGILAVPGLVVDGEVKSAGSVPSKQEIINWIKEAGKSRR